MLDQHLWTFSDAAFLPHGTAADGHAEEQPVFLTDAPITPNGANVRVFVDGARPDILDETGLEMVLVLFSSSDPEGLQSARALWRSCKEKGRAAVYFTQGEGRGWTETARLQTAEPA